MADTDIVTTDGGQTELFTETETYTRKEYGPEMSMTEFVQWMDTNFGSRSVNEALQQAAFMLCCDIISQDLAKSTLRLRERLKNNTSRVVHPEEHPIAGLLATEPNPRHGWYNLTEMMVLWHSLTKNAIAVIKRKGKGLDIAEIIPVRTTRVIEVVEGREIFYQVTAGTLQEQALLGTTFMSVPERDIIHVRGRMLDGMDGFSTLEAGRKTLKAGHAIDEYRGKLFEEDGLIRGVFKRDSTTGPLPDEAFQRLRAQMRALMSRFRTGVDPIILEGGLSFQEIAATPVDLELSKQFHAQIISTARLLRVPPHKLFELDGAKYDNMETQEKAYVGDTLIPIAKQFEERFAKSLLYGKDRLKYFFQYDREEMTLRDPQREIDRLVKALERGGMTWDEFRAGIGLNELANGQGSHRIVPVNMNVIDENGNVVVSGSSKGDGLPSDSSGTSNKSDGGSPVRLAFSNE